MKIVSFACTDLCEPVLVFLLEFGIFGVFRHQDAVLQCREVVRMLAEYLFVILMGFFTVFFEYEIVRAEVV